MDACRDIPIHEKLLKRLITKIVSSLDNVELNGFPPLAYQALLLTQKGEKITLLIGICNYLNKLENIAAATVAAQNIRLSQVVDEISSTDQTVIRIKDVATMEGTILHHLMFAMQQDHVILNFVQDYNFVGTRK